MSFDPAGIVRGLDRLRRAVLPRGNPDAWPGGDLEPAFAGVGGPEDDAPPARACVFCGATRHVIPHRGKGICVDCVAEIRRIVSSD